MSCFRRCIVALTWLYILLDKLYGLVIIEFGSRFGNENFYLFLLIRKAKDILLNEIKVIDFATVVLKLF